MTDTRALVEAAQTGNRDAFAQLYQHYHDTVFGFIYFRIGNRRDSEDLTQDVFLRALRRLETFTWQGKDFGAWLTTIARNIVTDHRKSHHYQRSTVSDHTDEANGAWWSADTDRRIDAQAVVEAAETAAALDRALAQLTGKQREVLRLRFGSDLSVDETALALGMEASAIKSLQHRATQAMRRHPALRSLTEVAA